MKMTMIVSVFKGQVGSHYVVDNNTYKCLEDEKILFQVTAEEPPGPLAERLLKLSRIEAKKRGITIDF